MNSDSAAEQKQPSVEADLNRYKQAAELAYRYAKNQADEKLKENPSFEEETSKEPTKDKEMV